MMTHQTSALARKADDRKDLERRVQQHLATGGSLSTLPYLARSKPRIPKDYQSEAPRVRGIAAESRAKKRAADRHATTFADLLKTLERPHEQAQAEQSASPPGP
jgi:RNA 3'-terminal phosphate cyclase